MKFMITPNFFRKNCRTVEADLWDYANGRLSEDRLERVERHLSVCERCQHETAGFAQAQTALLEVGQEMIPAPRTGWRELESRLELEATNELPVFSETPTRRPRFITAMTLLASFSSVATLLLVGVLVRQNHEAKLAEINSNANLPISRGETAHALSTKSGNHNSIKSSNDDATTLENLFGTGVQGLEQVNYQETKSVRPTWHPTREKRAKIEKHEGTTKRTRTLSNSEQDNRGATPKTGEETSVNGITFHPQKPTASERAIEHPAEKQGYVASGLIPVNNDDIY